MKLTTNTIEYLRQTGDTVIVGPYSTNRAIQSRICAYNKKFGTKLRVQQSKVIVVDVKKDVCTAMWEVRIV